MSELEHTSAGRISVSSQALSKLVVRAAEQVDSARVRRARRGLSVEVGEGRARVGLELAVRRGSVVPDLAHEVQERVAGAMRAMLEVEVDAVDVTVEELD